MSSRCCDQCRCDPFAGLGHAEKGQPVLSPCPLVSAAPERLDDRCLWTQGHLRGDDVPSNLGIAITLVKHIEEGVIPLFVETIGDAITTNHVQRILRRYLADSPVLVRSSGGEDLLMSVDDADQYLTPYLGMIA
ncbi:hypothetical protein KS4_34130 [Poriferisphaera corsica]|uniref:Uncharacterized protein n=2 Tax=Poriferisphaera corsica TaxID=2528020 RepID=A0A517YYM3_9BACT|nr:hypothetical protein KS4_34130 [Poriferisphaera corsica]